MNKIITQGLSKSNDDTSVYIKLCLRMAFKKLENSSGNGAGFAHRALLALRVIATLQAVLSCLHSKKRMTVPFFLLLAGTLLSLLLPSGDPLQEGEEERELFSAPRVIVKYLSKNKELYLSLFPSFPFCVKGIDATVFVHCC